MQASVLKLCSTILALALLSGVCRGAAVSSGRIPLDINGIIDNSTSQVREALRSVDPLVCRDLRETFSEKALFVTVYGSASFKVVLHGLSTISRVSDFVAKSDWSSEFACLSGTIGLRNLLGKIHGSASFMGIWVSFNGDVKINLVNIGTRVCYNAVKGGYGNLKKFEVTEFSPIDVSISGLGPLNWIFGKIAEGVIRTVRIEIKQEMENIGKTKFREALGGIKLPPLPKEWRENLR